MTILCLSIGYSITLANSLHGLLRKSVKHTALSNQNMERHALFSYRAWMMSFIFHTVIQKNKAKLYPFSITEESVTLFVLTVLEHSHIITE